MLAIPKRAESSGSSSTTEVGDSDSAAHLCSAHSVAVVLQLKAAEKSLYSIPYFPLFATHFR